MDIFGRMSSGYGKLYLIPNVLSASAPDNYLPDFIRAQVHELTHFIVESEKGGRALIKRLGIRATQQELVIETWNEHSDGKDMGRMLRLLENGTDVGIISDAGIPCVADPGADIVKAAHSKGVRVVPLPGASSILLALMGSGLNGQGFVFHGYLPVTRPERVRRIRELESSAQRTGQSQLFMEAPYRNNHVAADILANCKAETFLCIACDISSPHESIRTLRVRDWAGQLPDLHKKPVIFILGS
jgi:16S rRNA (cytidine1402-2'-O)-methyltransferase